MIRIFASLALLLLAPMPAAVAAPPAPARVVLETTAGPITIELATRQAPITTRNFLAYVDQKKLDGTSFYRAARTPRTKGRGFIQGGIRHTISRALPPIAHEPTSKTGLKHLDGTISMARTRPGSAMGDFFITVGPMPSMDAKPGGPGDNLGYAAFGRVVSGMPVVRKILAAPTVTQKGKSAMVGQMIADPIRITSARRVR